MNIKYQCIVSCFDMINLCICKDAMINITADTMEQAEQLAAKVMNKKDKPREGCTWICEFVVELPQDEFIPLEFVF